MTNSLIYLLVITFIAVTVLAKLILSHVLYKAKYEKRLKKYIEIKTVDKHENKKEISQPSERFYLKRVSSGIERVLNLSKHEKLLVQSGIQLSQGEVFIGRLMVAVIAISIGVFYDFPILLIISCGFVGFYLPIMYVKKGRKKRLEKCSNQLGEALGTMANALRAGFSFMQAMKMVAKEIDDPLGPEFSKALQEINYGVSVENAFRGLIERLPDKELEIVLNTLIIQRSTGGT
ncbi:type II secretion system F family protein [Virgibacillus phasianinus]|nr:type II secretion system F family protein [Virgibacillus phasianinus]